MKKQQLWRMIVSELAADAVSLKSEMKEYLWRMIAATRCFLGIHNYHPTKNFSYTKTCTRCGDFRWVTFPDWMKNEKH